MSEFTVIQEGLITKQTPVALPAGASDCLINFDVNELGKLTRRQGTQRRTAIPGLLYHVKHIGQVELLFVVTSTGITIYAADLETVIADIPNIYDNTIGSYNAVDADTVLYASVVIFSNYCNPVQVFLHRLVYTHASETTVRLKLPKWIATRVVAFDGNTPVNITVTQVDADTIDVYYEGFTAELTLLYWSYGVWFSAQYYFGDELFRSVPKGTNQVVQVPLELTTELTINSPLIVPYADNNTPYVVTQSPRYYTDLGFSDGQTYTYSGSSSINYSPYFVTLGKPLYERIFTLTIENVNVAENVLTYEAHNLLEDTVLLFLDEAPGGVSINTTYRVKNAQNGKFSLETTAGTPVTLTSPYDTARTVLEYRASDITSDGGFYDTGADSAILPYRLYTNTLLPPGFTAGEVYYISVDDTANTASVFLDKAGEFKLVVPRFKLLTFESADVNTTDNTITIPGHSWANQIPVAVVSSTAPAGVTVKATYYLLVVDANTVQLYSDYDLTTVVDITGTGSGIMQLTESWGVWYFKPEYINGSFSVQNYNDLMLVRARQLKSSDIRVRVNDTVYERNTTAGRVAQTYRVVDASLALVTTAIIPDAHYILFDSEAVLGVPKNSFVQIVDMTKGSEMNAAFSPGSTYNDPFSLNTIITIYGYSAHFISSRQPVAGLVIQNRLALAVGYSVIFSNSADSFIKDEFYNNFAIDDRLTGLATEQFEIVVSDVIVHLREHQNALFIFAYSNIYRATNLSFTTYQVLKVANHGVPNKRVITDLQSTVVYANSYGVYKLAVDVQETYYASELSVNISNVVRKTNPALLLFDEAQDRLFYVTDNSVYVLHTRSGAWTEYKFAFKPVVTAGFVLDDELSFVDTVYGVLTFRDVPFDAYTVTEHAGGADALGVDTGSLESSVNGILTGAIQYAGGDNAIPFVEDYYNDSFTLIDLEGVTHDYINCDVSVNFAYRRVDAAFFVDDLALNELPSPNTVWTSVAHGYIVRAVFLSSCVKTQLSTHSRVIFLELVVELLEEGIVFDIGVIYGNRNEPVWLRDVFSVVSVPDKATFAVLKEALQGISNLYRLIVVCKHSKRASLSGFSFLDVSGDTLFTSGGR